MKKLSPILAFLAFLSILSFGLLSGTGTAKAVQTSFQQSILPMDCLVSSVQTGSGSNVSLQTSGCGTIIPNPPSGSASPTTGSPISNTPLDIGQSSNNSTGGKTVPQVFLNDMGSIYRKGGFLLRVQEGVVLRFRLAQDSSSGIARSLKIVSVGEHGLLVQLMPGEEFITLVPGEKYKLNLGYDKQIDMTLTYTKGNGAGDGYIRVTFPLQKMDDKVIDEHRAVFVWTTMITSVGLMAAANLFHGLIKGIELTGHWLPHHKY